MLSMVSNMDQNQSVHFCALSHVLSVPVFSLILNVSVERAQVGELGIYGPFPGGITSTYCDLYVLWKYASLLIKPIET